jgi:hypothetical protein
MKVKPNWLAGTMHVPNQLPLLSCAEVRTRIIPHQRWGILEMSLQARNILYIDYVFRLHRIDAPSSQLKRKIAELSSICFALELYSARGHLFDVVLC